MSVSLKIRAWGCVLTEVHAALYHSLFDQTALERHRGLQEAQQRYLRRSA